jgi:hypothetical protein
METETPDAPSVSKRPRPILLILLGIAVAAFLLMRLGGSTGTGGQPSDPGRAPQPAGAAAADVEPERLDVRLDSLSAERPGPGDSERNPFRFRAKAAPPPEPPAGGFKPGTPNETEPQGPVAETVPPITVKFLGTMDMPDGSTLAVFTDCSQGGRRTKPFREGEPVFGQYRLVKIGLQSVVIEHLDGRGRTTLPKTGQECVWK